MTAATPTPNGTPGAGHATAGWLPPNVSHNPAAVFFWYVHLYCTPPIIVLGLVGNCLSFLVFTRTNQRHLSSSVYLAALAVVDSIFLLQLSLLWPTYLRVFLIHRQGLCQLIIYTSYVSSFLSVWIVVAFTVERFIVCMSPLRRSTMCTPGRAKAVVISLVVFGSLAYSYNTWTTTVTVTSKSNSHGVCSVRVEFQAMVDVIGLIDSFITLVLPVLAIIAMNVKIARKLVDFREQPSMRANIPRQSCLSRPSDGTSAAQPCLPRSSHHAYAPPCPRPSTDSSTTLGSRPTNYSPRGRTQIKVTKMLLLVSSFFLVLNVPSHVVRVYDTFQTFFDPTYSPPSYLVLCQQFFTFLFNCNFSVNFCLYSLCGTSFRKALTALLHRYWLGVSRCCGWSRGVRCRRGGGVREASQAPPGVSLTGF